MILVAFFLFEETAGQAAGTPSPQPAPEAQRFAVPAVPATAL